MQAGQKDHRTLPIRMELQKASATSGEGIEGSNEAINSSGDRTSSSITGRTKERDFAEHLEAYLARRDGVDKFLKIARYSTKVILASTVIPKDALLAKRLKDFEASVGVSRKAFRLGKFIQDFNALRKVSVNSRGGVLEIVAYGGEGVYYFVEQFTWLIKAGLIDKRYAARLQKISAWAELIGYFGSVGSKSLQVSALWEKETALASKIVKVSEGDHVLENDAEEINQLRKKRVLKMASIIQDFADGLMALSDVRDGKGALSNVFILACAGLLSALISTHKNWSAC